MVLSSVQIGHVREKKTRTARTYSVQFVNELFKPVLRIDSSKRSDSKERISALRVRECEKDRQKCYTAKSVITGRLDVNINIYLCFALDYVIKSIAYSFIIDILFHHFWWQAHQDEMSLLHIKLCDSCHE